jgi:hypothetical protein
MYMLYVDDSGSPANQNDKCCVLAGFVTREDQNYWIQQNIDHLVTEHMGTPNRELHGSPLRSGRGEWHQVPKAKREALFMATLNHIAENYPRQFILFGAVILALSSWRCHQESGGQCIGRSIYANYEPF